MKRSETTEQIEVFNWAKCWKDLEPRLGLMFHVPNEGKRQGSSGKLEKAMGMRAGVPDIFLPVRGMHGESGLFIEMKYGSNRRTKEQKEFMAAVAGQGYKAVTCYSAAAAEQEISMYLYQDRGFTLASCCGHVLPDDSCKGMYDWERCKDCRLRR